MNTKKIVATIALLLSAMSAALAQSPYTTGTAASSEAAGYPSPDGYGSGLYAYVPDNRNGHVAEAHHRPGWVELKY